MRIRIEQKEPLETASFKIPGILKSEIAAISRKEGVPQSEIVRAFLDSALQSYRNGDVIRSWAGEEMNVLRKHLKPGMRVISNGIVGTVSVISEDLVEITMKDGHCIEMLKECVTDVLNPGQELIDIVEQAHDELERKRCA